MDAEMESTLVIVWMAGGVCGTAFFVGLGTLIYLWWKKRMNRLMIFPFIEIVIGFMGMSYSLSTLLRIVRSYIAL